MDTLLQKGCTVHAVEFPTPEQAQALRDATMGPVLDRLEALSHPKIRRYRNIALADPQGRNIWLDADHVNHLGRTLMTKYLVDHVFRAMAPSPTR